MAVCQCVCVGGGRGGGRRGRAGWNTCTSNCSQICRVCLCRVCFCPANDLFVSLQADRAYKTFTAAAEKSKRPVPKEANVLKERIALCEAVRDLADSKKLANFKLATVQNHLELLADFLPDFPVDLQAKIIVRMSQSKLSDIMQMPNTELEEAVLKMKEWSALLLPWTSAEHPVQVELLDSLKPSLRPVVYAVRASMDGMEEDGGEVDPDRLLDSLMPGGKNDASEEEEEARVLCSLEFQKV